MIIKIDSKLLEEQIAICDAYANMHKYEPLKEMFKGIANLLTEISGAIENNDAIYFEEM